MSNYHFAFSAWIISIIALAVGCSPTASWAAGTTTLISKSSFGDYGASGASWSPSISADGRFVAFASNAADLPARVPAGSMRAPRTEPDGPRWRFVPNTSIFVADRQTGEIEEISLAWDGRGLANDWSALPMISAHGNAVVFVSAADNLVPNDTNGQPDVFVHDRATHETVRVSIRPDGTGFEHLYAHSVPIAPVISADGRFAAFGVDHLVYLHDRISGQTELISLPVFMSSGPVTPIQVSADGRHVFAKVNATVQLTSVIFRDYDILAFDRSTQQVERLCVTQNGSPLLCEGGSVSADGNLVAFTKYGSRNMFIHDRTARRTLSIGAGVSPRISPDGGFVAFLNSNKPSAKVFLLERSSGKIRLASIHPEGGILKAGSSSFDVSADGRAVAFSAKAKSHTVAKQFQVLVRDRTGR